MEGQQLSSGTVATPKAVLGTWPGEQRCQIQGPPACPSHPGRKRPLAGKRQCGSLFGPSLTSRAIRFSSLTSSWLNSRLPDGE